MKKFLSLILFSLCLFSVKGADSNWKLHPIFDEEVEHVLVTPSYVYFTSLQMMENNVNEVFRSLFRYDRKGDELMPLSSSNILNGNAVRHVIYNFRKGYVGVVYKDYDIDLLMNDGKVANIPFYRQSSLGYSKGINSMSIDPDKDRLYLATDFGYVAINDRKNEVAESRIYGEPVKAVMRLGDYFFITKDDQLLMAPASSQRLSLADYEQVDNFDDPYALYYLNDKVGIMLVKSGGQTQVKKITIGEEGPEITQLMAGRIYNVDYNPYGLTITSANNLYHFKTDGSVLSVERPEGFRNSAASTDNMTEIWNAQKRQGLSSVKKSGDQWSITRNWMLPNAPATYATTSYVNHPTYGFLMLDYGYLQPTSQLYSHTPLQLSGYKQGRWKNYAPAYTNPDRASMMTGANGMAVDPDNKSYVYISSYHTGMVRLNLSDPTDIIHMSSSKDTDSKKDGFVVLPGMPDRYPSFSNITPPYFDSKGNLWMLYQDWDDSNDPNPHFFCWTAEDRRATTSAKDIKLPKIVEFDTYFPLSNLAISLPLLKTGNGLIVLSGAQFQENLLLANTNGTPTDTSDDKYYRFPSYYDSDGNNIDMGSMLCLWEDPSTGYVWIGHNNGVCYFIPSQVLNGNYQLYRPKVSRNDGTNLADYLLSGVAVNWITSDADGRKWFATAGGGVICTTSDGREILEEFNTSNSPLPADVVYGIGYNSESNSLMISTEEGYAEYSLPVSESVATKADVKAYPNPVRPDYSGYVTITDIPDGSFVKITDVAGNLVKDLGIMSGFEMLWDLSDTKFNRVKSGVYHIMISPGNENGSYSGVGKILVIS